MEKLISDFIEQFAKFIKDNGPVVSLFTFFLGALLGNHFALGRDKRKEFNTIIEPIRLTLFKESQNPTPYTKGISDIDIFSLRERLPKKRALRLNKAIEKYKESKSDKNRKQDGFGQAFFIDPKKVVHSIEDLLEIIKRK